MPITVTIAIDFTAAAAALILADPTRYGATQSAGGEVVIDDAARDHAIADLRASVRPPVIGTRPAPRPLRRA